MPAHSTAQRREAFKTIQSRSAAVVADKFPQFASKPGSAGIGAARRAGSSNPVDHRALVPITKLQPASVRRCEACGLTLPEPMVVFSRPKTIGISLIYRGANGH
jgi:hypothetical protein